MRAERNSVVGGSELKVGSVVRSCARAHKFPPIAIGWVSARLCLVGSQLAHSTAFGVSGAVGPMHAAFGLCVDWASSFCKFALRRTELFVKQTFRCQCFWTMALGITKQARPKRPSLSPSASLLWGQMRLGFQHTSPEIDRVSNFWFRSLLGPRGC